MIELGFFSFITSLVLCFLGAIPILRYKLINFNNYNWLISGQLSFSYLSILCLIWAHITSDFSVKVVANHSHSLMSLFYKLTSVWGHHEGSVFFNFFMISLVSWIFLIVERKIPRKMMHSIQSVQCLILFLIGTYILFTANPFERLLPFPREGYGLNPLLHDPGLAYHPPILFSGSCLLTIVYSLAVTSCYYENIPKRIIRRWSLLAFGFLTFGISLGSFWAYYVLGWGGWWFWDPVEALSLAPWLILLISIHSIGLKDSHRFTACFNMLALVFFLLSTLIIRSGILTSVHNFAVDDIGFFYLLSVILILLLLGMHKFFLYTNKRQTNFTSQKDKILLLHMIFVTYALLVVLLGVLGPVIYKFLWQENMSLGPRYFSTLLLPAFYIWILLLLYYYLALFSNKFRILSLVMFSLSILSGLCIYLTYAQSQNSIVDIASGSFMIGLGIAVCLSSIISVIIQLIRKINIHIPQFLSHLGLGIFIIGLASGYYLETESFKNIGEKQSICILGDRYKLESVYKTPKLNSLSTVAELLMLDSNKGFHKKARPERRYFYYSDSFYPVSDMLFKRLIVHQITLGEANKDGTWQIRVKKSPLLLLAWVSGVFIFVGCSVGFFRRGEQEK